ncbi:MAG: hypothetical protein WCC04_09200 [Terriglobales bacterium]
MDRHCQLVAGTVEYEAALWRQFKAALLLVQSATLEVTVAENLKVDEA